MLEKVKHLGLDGGNIALVSQCPAINIKGPIANVLRAALAFAAITTLGYIVLVYVLSYCTTKMQMDRSTVLLMVLLASVVQLVTTLVFAALSDRVGRRRMFMAGAIGGAAWAIPFFHLLDTRDPWLLLLALSVNVSCQAAMYGPTGAIAAKLFPTTVRYSGISLGCQIGSIFGGGLAPTIAAALFAATGTSLSTALYVAGICLASLIVMAIGPETYRTSLEANQGSTAFD